MATNTIEVDPTGQTERTHDPELVERIFRRYPVVNVFIQTDTSESREEGTLAVIKAMFPLWEISALKFKQFKDGITNKLFKVSISTTGSRFSLLDSQGFHPTLIRIYGYKTELIIDREQEIVNMVCLSEQGFSAPLYGRFLNGICYGFTPGMPFTPEDMRDPHKSSLVASELARFHNVHIAGDQSPKLFKTLSKWLDEVPSSFENPDQNQKFQSMFNMDSTRKEFQWLMAELTKLPVDVVFCHNDLLCGNILFDKGGESGQTPDEVHFIDYEYGGYNYRYFDIGNHFCEMMGYDVQTEHYPSKEVQLRWLTAYRDEVINAARKTPSSPTAVASAAFLSKVSLEEMYRSVNKFAMAAHFYWAVWALIQARYSDIDFDYLAYSASRFGEYFKRKETIFAN